ncbi:MAG: hypothetical protein H6709_14165 [Kofleriaceae bacterium]|nr:hypothetical protein [Kofleriaceae bacterium]
MKLAPHWVIGALLLGLTSTASAQPKGGGKPGQPAPPAPAPAPAAPADDAADDAAPPPTAERAADADATDVDALRQEYLALRDELFASRARAATVASTLYSTQISIKLAYTTGRFYGVDRATIRLDGAKVYDDTEGAVASDDAVRFEGWIAPGRHQVSIRVEATGKDDERFTSATESTFVVEAVAGKDLMITARAKDGGDIPYQWKRGEHGTYQLVLDADVKTVARPGAKAAAKAAAAPPAAPARAAGPRTRAEPARTAASPRPPAAPRRARVLRAPGSQPARRAAATAAIAVATLLGVAQAPPAPATATPPAPTRPPPCPPPTSWPSTSPSWSR